MHRVLALTPVAFVLFVACSTSPGVPRATVTRTETASPSVPPELAACHDALWGIRVAMGYLDETTLEGERIVDRAGERVVDYDELSFGAVLLNYAVSGVRFELQNVKDAVRDCALGLRELGIRAD